MSMLRATPSGSVKEDILARREEEQRMLMITLVQ